MIDISIYIYMFVFHEITQNMIASVLYSDATSHDDDGEE